VLFRYKLLFIFVILGFSAQSQFLDLWRGNRFSGIERYHNYYGGSFDMTLGIGMGEEHASFDMIYNRRLNERLKVGFGIGFHSSLTYLKVPDNLEFNSIDIENSFGVLIGRGIYYFTDNGVRPYAKVSAGHTIFPLLAADPNTSINGGFVANYGIGMQFPSRRRIKYYIELNQYHTRASGETLAQDQLQNLIPVSYDFGINRFNLVFGMEFNGND